MEDFSDVGNIGSEFPESGSIGSDIAPWFTQVTQTEGNIARESTLSIISRLNSEKWESTLMFVELGLLLFFVAGIIVWWSLLRTQLKAQYKDMIDWIDDLRKSGQYYGKGTGIQFAFWYHYPHLSVVQLTNINLPAAVVYGYYGSPGGISDNFKSAPNPGTSSLQSMFDYSELYDRATSIQILCYWVNCCSIDKETSFCTEYCGIPQVYTGAQAATTITTTSLGYCMSFSIIGGPIGALVGLSLGAANGVWESRANANWYQQECQFSESQGCQNPSSISCGTIV